MTASVARQEDHAGIMDSTEKKGIRGLSPWAFHGTPFQILHSGNAVEPTSADDGQKRRGVKISHGFLFSPCAGLGRSESLMMTAPKEWSKPLREGINGVVRS